MNIIHEPQARHIAANVVSCVRFVERCLPPECRNSAATPWSNDQQGERATGRPRLGLLSLNGRSHKINARLRPRLHLRRIAADLERKSVLAGFSRHNRERQYFLPGYQMKGRPLTRDEEHRIAA
jgi:hypothetical protein